MSQLSSQVPSDPFQMFLQAAQAMILAMNPGVVPGTTEFEEAGLRTWESLSLEQRKIFRDQHHSLLDRQENQLRPRGPTKAPSITQQAEGKLEEGKNLVASSSSPSPSFPSTSSPSASASASASAPPPSLSINPRSLRDHMQWAAVLGLAAPKRPHTAYLMFCASTRPRLRRENPDLSFAELAKRTGAMWKEMDEQQRQPYSEESRASRERYDREKAVFDRAVEEYKRAHGMPVNNNDHEEEEEEEDRMDVE